MTNTKSNIEVHLGKFDKFLQWLSTALFLFIIIFALVSWFKLPQIIPTHFNYLGEIDGYGSKNQIFILLPIIALLYFILGIQGKHPNTYNYLVTITPDNAEIQYRMLARLLRVTRLEVMMVFAYLETTMILSAFGNKLTLGGWFLPVTLIVIFGTIGIYLYKSAKAK